MKAGQESPAAASPARPWHTDTPVTAGLARDIIRAQFPELRARRVVPIGGGWDNTAFLVDDAVVFRFPRSTRAVALLETEARVLPRLAPLLPLPIPVPEWPGQPSALFPRSFLGYPVLPGRSACAARLGDAERENAAPILADFLSRLHAIPIEGLPLPPDLLQRTEFSSRLPLIEERLHILRRHGIISEPARWLQRFENLGEPAAGRAPVVAHGDFYACNILVDGNSGISGVIDWGDVHAGDAATDLLIVYAFFPQRVRATFFEVYGTIDAATVHRARLRAAFHAIAVAWTGAETGDADLATEGCSAMHFALEGE